MSKKKKLSSILAESYAVYFEFIGIIISWLLIAYLLFCLLYTSDAADDSYRAYQHVKNNN